MKNLTNPTNEGDQSEAVEGRTYLEKLEGSIKTRFTDSEEQIRMIFSLEYIRTHTQLSAVKTSVSTIKYKDS